MKAFATILAVSLICCVYSQTYGYSRTRYGPSRGYDDDFDDFDGFHGGSRRFWPRGRSGFGMLTGGRRFHHSDNDGIFRSRGSRFMNTGSSYMPKRHGYPTIY